MNNNQPQFYLKQEERELIESLRRNGVVIDHRTGTAYVITDGISVTDEMVQAAAESRTTDSDGFVQTLQDVMACDDKGAVIRAALEAALRASIVEQVRGGAQGIEGAAESRSDEGGREQSGPPQSPVAVISDAPDTLPKKK